MCVLCVRVHLARGNRETERVRLKEEGRGEEKMGMGVCSAGRCVPTRGYLNSACLDESLAKVGRV